MREKDYKGKGKRAQVKGDIWVGVGNEFDEAPVVENHRVALIDVSQAEKQMFMYMLRSKTMEKCVLVWKLL